MKLSARIRSKLLLTALLLQAIIPILSSGVAHAASFDPTNIIDNYTFYNSSSMTVQQIQDFLNARVPICETNHAGFTGGSGTVYSPPWVCLKDYYENSNLTYTVSYSYKDTSGAENNVTRTFTQNNAYIYTSLTPVYINNDYRQGVDSIVATIQSQNGTRPANSISAAQIIWNAAQTYEINPQVLLVTLQKETGLVTDTWAASWQYQQAMGFACTDSAPCDDNYSGFYNQVTSAARQFRNYANNPNYYNYVPGPGNNVRYNPNVACGYTKLNIQNQATASLYDYTPYQPNSVALAAGYGTGDSCSAYGNRNFWLYFNDWFESTQSSINCSSKVAGVTCVWSAFKQDGSQFLTISRSELDNAIANSGWAYGGTAFYASQTQQEGTVPVYRLRYSGGYFYTTSSSEKNAAVSIYGYIDEGIVFYVYPSTASSNASHLVYRLYKPATNQRYWTSDERKKDFRLNNGYVLEPDTFNGFSGLLKLPVPSADRSNIYKLKENVGYFYTTNLSELESVINNGYLYDGVLTTASASNTGTPVYRLQNGGRHFYTASSAEKDIAVSKYGYIYEGVGFYVDDNSAQIYRLANTRNSSYLYTSRIDEVMSFANTSGWTYDGTLVYNNSGQSPVYRFLNLLNNKHFYTIDMNEATRITNKGWQYETVAFYASKSSGPGLPVYRLLNYDKHFYTTDTNEKNIAVSKYGYLYEGVAFYVSPSPTATPVYRLQGGSGEYFYTASSAEKDTAVSKYGYQYEGEGFYLTAN